MTAPHSPSAPDVASERPVLLFDGDCNFCRASVHWLVEHDPDGSLHYAPLESETGRTLLAQRAIDPESVESVLLIDGGTVYAKSEAVFEALEHIAGPWRMSRHLRRFPRALRDFGYDRVSKNRPFISRLIGTIDHRYEPRGEARQRFLST